MKYLKLPSLLNIGIANDDRGFLEFFNEFYKYDIKRFYIINNNQNNFIRAWHAHKNESKIFYCLNGYIQISAVKVTNFKNPSKKSKIHNFFLSDKQHRLLYVPGGFANGIKFFNFSDRLMVFSSSKLEDSLNDDFRYNFDYWDPWVSVFR